MELLVPHRDLLAKMANAKKPRRSGAFPFSKGRFAAISTA